MCAFRVLLAGVVIGPFLLACSGCQTAPRQTPRSIDIPDVQVLVTREILPTTFDRYKSVGFNRATTTLGGGICPPMVIATYDRAASQVAQRLRDVFPGGLPRLTIDTDIHFVQKKGPLGTAQFLARVTAYDGGRIVVDTVVNVQTHSLREGIVYDLAEHAAAAVGNWLRAQKTGK